MNASSHRPAYPGRLLYRAVKRAADVTLSVAGIALLAVPVAVVAIVIKVDSPGPALIAQLRTGRGGRPFRVLKLRTMRADAEDVGAYLTPEQIERWEAEHTLLDDPRITRVGRFLRSTSFDEVPQFLNVLVGQMSLVGPRPMLREELDWYGDDVDELLSVRPGLTGLWQVTKRNDATFESGERQELDLRYIRRRSLRLDLWILLRTFRSIVRRTGI